MIPQPVARDFLGIGHAAVLPMVVAHVLRAGAGHHVLGDLLAAERLGQEVAAVEEGAMIGVAVRHDDVDLAVVAPARGVDPRHVLALSVAPLARHVKRHAGRHAPGAAQVVEALVVDLLGLELEVDHGVAHDAVVLGVLVLVPLRVGGLPLRRLVERGALAGGQRDGAGAKGGGERDEKRRDERERAARRRSSRRVG